MEKANKQTNGKGAVSCWVQVPGGVAKSSLDEDAVSELPLKGAASKRAKFETVGLSRRDSTNKTQTAQRPRLTSKWNSSSSVGGCELIGRK